MMSSSGAKLKFVDRLLAGTVPIIAAFLMRLLYRTLRVDIINEASVRERWDRGENFFLIFWHEHILMMVTAYSGPGVKLLISRSKDGELLAKTMKRFGHDSVRGSSSRGGRAAFRELLGVTKQKADIAMTPDGPRGPRRELKDGILQLAKASGRGVVPVAFVCSRGHRFNSWDHFVCPYPFARAVYAYGEPVYYHEHEDIEHFRDRLIAAINENERQAMIRLESYGLSAI